MPDRRTVHPAALRKIIVAGQGLAIAVRRGHTALVTRDAVYRTLQARPFRRFSLRLTDGSLVAVPHPEFILLTQGGRTAVVNTEGEDFRILDLSLVTAIEVESPSGG